MLVEAVVLDVGETLVDETEVWGTWADAVGVSRLTFFAALGATISSGAGDHRRVFGVVRPGLTFAEAARSRGTGEVGFTERDLYPDAAPALHALHRAGFQVGIAANQPPAAAPTLERCGLDYDWLLISALERVAKPDPAFFALVARRAGLPPSRIAYVGDRLDNDVAPATAAGLQAIHLRRGPWGVVQASARTATPVSTQVHSLVELVNLLTGER